MLPEIAVTALAVVSLIGSGIGYWDRRRLRAEVAKAYATVDAVHASIKPLTGAARRIIACGKRADSFYGTVPKRQEEVAYNDALEALITAMRPLTDPPAAPTTFSEGLQTMQLKPLHDHHFRAVGGIAAPGPLDARREVQEEARRLEEESPSAAHGVIDLMAPEDQT